MYSDEIPLLVLLITFYSHRILLCAQNKISKVISTCLERDKSNFDLQLNINTVIWFRMWVCNAQKNKGGQNYI